ncbi:MAG TPA: hypothetical protein VK737_05300, partial [Opitutales bacterium]|nr:hypothetical protein [Opitutales bacterium]
MRRPPLAPDLVMEPDVIPVPPAAPAPAPALAAPVAETPAFPPVSAEEKTARRTIVRYRQRMDWALHIPEFELFF